MYEHEHHSYDYDRREVGIVDAATAAARWQAGTSTGQQRFIEGVQSTSKDPTALAVAAQGKMLTNVTQAVSSGRWARGLQRAGKAGWQAATVAKASNWSTGIQASADKYAQAIGPVLQIEASLQQQVQQMPNNSLADSIQRMTFWATQLHQWAQSR